MDRETDIFISFSASSQTNGSLKGKEQARELMNVSQRTTTSIRRTPRPILPPFFSGISTTLPPCTNPSRMIWDLSRRWNHASASPRIPKETGTGDKTSGTIITQERPASQAVIQTPSISGAVADTKDAQGKEPALGLIARASRAMSLAPTKDGEGNPNSSIKKLVDLARPEKKQLTTAIGLVCRLSGTLPLSEI
jgi:hypothetical protein